MKKTLALLTLAAALAAPLSAQAHRAWMAPTSTSLSGADSWVSISAGMSNGVFIPDHAAMRMGGLVVTSPDGSAVEAQNLSQGRLRTTFDLHLTANGTYKVANVTEGFMATYTQDGEQKRWRGAEADFAGAIPAGATNVSPTRTFSRVETFVTLNNPTDSAFAPTGKGLELVPVTHPNDLVEGEAASFKLLNNGQAAADVTVTVAREGIRYRDNPEELTATTAADGTFSVTWGGSGLHWINASVRSEGQDGQPGLNASYVGIVEVLP